eukprot:TRINITY_DN2547_c0_g3_i1.p1 TRINITY_DN2547_c0_g3~~TRINITY_DN2547_c0_g3_i1.p1  ORF type:complete len:451 (+),score=108.88 TRINITY_DN2547_c0_g3_i1:74-1426(+)
MNVQGNAPRQGGPQQQQQQQQPQQDGAGSQSRRCSPVAKELYVCGSCLALYLTIVCVVSYYCCWWVVLFNWDTGYRCSPGGSSGQVCHGTDCVGRLRLRNGCDKEPIWIANQGHRTAYLDPQMVKLLPGETVAFDIPKEGLASTRFWPLARCASDGTTCQIGGSVGSTNGLPPCDAVGCAPPVDSKFEATWGCKLSESECGHIPAETGGGTLKGDDYFDVSLVDGFTLPYKLEFDGGCEPQNRLGKRVHSWSADQLNYMTMCPSSEDLDGKSGLDLRVYHPGSRKVVGCSSPCSRLTIPNWQKTPYQFPNAGDDAKMYCCPAGSLGPGQETPRRCEEGPVATTKFVESVHCYAPDVYAYSYDDGVGNFRCPPTTVYTMTFFCPPDGGGPPISCTPAPPTPPPPPATPAPTGPCTLAPCSAGQTCCAPGIGQLCPGNVPCCDCGSPACACP